jgi:hypothetical protein
MPEIDATSTFESLTVFQLQAVTAVTGSAGVDCAPRPAGGNRAMNGDNYGEHCRATLIVINYDT